MQAVKVIRRMSSPFYADDDKHERYPAFRADNAQIDNPVEWHLWESIQIAQHAAQEIVMDALNKHRKIAELGGDNIKISYNFTLLREGPGFSTDHPGSQMVIACDIALYE